MVIVLLPNNYTQEECRELENVFHSNSLNDVEQYESLKFFQFLQYFNRTWLTDAVRQKFPDEKDCRNDVMASTDAIKDCKVYSERINLNVLGQDNVIIQFKIRKITQLRKLMYAYCENTGLAYNSVRFRFEGQPVNEIDTPASLNLEEGDIIEVFQQQTGGCKMLL
ncbi:small ubiquitin-related modifier 3-like [Rhopalosiphum maidis]|uniref:small ubiquitin-related modifier 3-like n=1 Tax=Rhopalosiphum maidis TaxID=43146 RepID=UPI000EFFB9E1|nr:small ubiquitin-related modifier 3-like [Rhopalosiphum maidis]